MDEAREATTTLLDVVIGLVEVSADDLGALAAACTTGGVPAAVASRALSLHHVGDEVLSEIQLAAALALLDWDADGRRIIRRVVRD